MKKDILAQNSITYIGINKHQRRVAKKTHPTVVRSSRVIILIVIVVAAGLAQNRLNLLNGNSRKCRKQVSGNIHSSTHTSSKANTLDV